jgi:BirA family biotin operon repressor/biotin-[acetyl-CoA-carboxylase] ligase
MDTFGITTLLKWPNDVVAGERKLGGILAEGLSGPQGVDAVVLGIGVNVVADMAALPPDVRALATSVAAETGRSVDTIDVAASVLARLTLWYDALGRDGSAPIVAAWRARSVPWWGRAVEIRSGTEVLRGVARDVDERGALLLDLGEGRVTPVLSGEVRELRLP